MSEMFTVGDASRIMLEIFDKIDEHVKSNDIEAISNIVAALDHIKRESAELLESAKERMAGLMGESPEYLQGDFFFEKKMGSSRKAWDHKALSAVVAKRLVDSSVDLDTGEILRNPTEMIQEAFEFAGVSYWRVKELQKLGINADSFCEVTEGKPSIIIRTTK